VVKLAVIVADFNRTVHQRGRYFAARVSAVIVDRNPEGVFDLRFKEALLKGNA
jgi:hypothetical protein